MIHEAMLQHLSDTTLYTEARQFVHDHRAPDQRQLVGLATFSRTWKELTDYVKHQSERDWSERQQHYKPFYAALQRYLLSLRQRVKTDFTLVPEGGNRREEQEALDTWAQALAQEFIQHLVAEASLQAIQREDE